MKYIAYRSGYKYQLAEDYYLQTDIKPEIIIKTDFIYLNLFGLLKVSKGYAWDGPSGPTFDTASSMRGSLVHDAFYQLLREGLLPSSDREKADQLLHDICTEDGMWKWRADLWLREVRKFAGSAADPTHIKKVIIAP